LSLPSLIKTSLGMMEYVAEGGMTVRCALICTLENINLAVISVKSMVYKSTVDDVIRFLYNIQNLINFG